MYNNSMIRSNLFLISDNLPVRTKKKYYDLLFSFSLLFFLKSSKYIKPEQHITIKFLEEAHELI